MPAPIVFFDFAGPDSAALKEFYSSLFGWDFSPQNQVSVPIASATTSPPTLMGAIRQDPTENMLYIGVDDITATLDEIVEKGGEINQPRFEVPGVVVLGIFKDPAGTRVGLVEMENGQAKVP